MAGPNPSERGQSGKDKGRKGVTPEKSKTAAALDKNIPMQKRSPQDAQTAQQNDTGTGCSDQDCK